MAALREDDILPRDDKLLLILEYKSSGGIWRLR
jgi:hypothetical protein